MPTLDGNSAGLSAQTLTPAHGDVSDYHEYLEKTSKKSSSLHTGSRREGSIVSPLPTVNKEIHLGSSDISPISSPGIGPGRSRLERIKISCSRKNCGQNLQRVEATKDPHGYPGPLALSLLTIGICLSVFLVSLDRTIVATAIPKITDQFHSSDDVGWYGSAYLLTAAALQPLYGRIFILFNMKWSFLCALGIFELGSLICGIAPNSVALIIGRAIAGWGSAGILTGSFVVVSHAVPLQRRPIFTASVGVMFALGAMVGPLLGGAFTDLVTWRWCFYFNLPVGGATAASMVFLFKPHKDAEESKKSLLEKILALDLLGNFLLIVAAVMLFTALQFNDQGWAWGSAREIGLLVGFGVTAIIFIFWQWRQGDDALLPPRIVLQRSVAAGAVAAFFIYGTLLIHAYYLPIWFQAIKGADAIQSGVDLIAYMVANAFFSVLAGIVVSKVGYFAPPAIIGAAIGTVGCGLLTTLEVTSGPSKWVVYQVIISIGLGLAIQQGVIAVQTVLKLDQVPIGIAAIISMQSLGGAVFVSVGNNILQNTLNQASAANEIPGIDLKAVIRAGATQFRSIVPTATLPALLVVYNNALCKTFICAIPLSGLACLASLVLEWKSVKDKEPTLEAAPGPTIESSADGKVRCETNKTEQRELQNDEKPREEDKSEEEDKPEEENKSEEEKKPEEEKPEEESGEDEKLGEDEKSGNQQKTSFETARTSLQNEAAEKADAVHLNPKQSQDPLPGSWSD